MRFEELNITPKAMQHLADARSKDIKSAGGFPDVLRIIENAAAMGQYTLKYYVSRNVQECVCATLDDLEFDYTVKAAMYTQIPIEASKGTLSLKDFKVIE